MPTVPLSVRLPTLNTSTPLPLSTVPVLPAAPSVASPVPVETVNAFAAVFTDAAVNAELVVVNVAGTVRVNAP